VMATLVIVVLALLVIAFVGYPLFAGKETAPEGQRGRRRDSNFQQVVVQQQAQIAPSMTLLVMCSESRDQRT